jgi:hypothetical protein
MRIYQKIVSDVTVSTAGQILTPWIPVPDSETADRFYFAVAVPTSGSVQQVRVGYTMEPRINANPLPFGYFTIDASSGSTPLMPIASTILNYPVRSFRAFTSASTQETVYDPEKTLLTGRFYNIYYGALSGGTSYGGTGGEVDMSGAEIIAAIDGEIGTEWKGGGAQPTDASVVYAVDSNLGQTYWKQGQPSDTSVVMAIDDNLGQTVWKEGQPSDASIVQAGEDYFWRSDGNTGLKIKALTTIAVCITPDVDDYYEILIAATADATIRTPGAITGTGRVIKTLAFESATAADVNLLFTGYEYGDLAEPSNVLPSGGAASYTLFTTDSGVTWYIQGDTKYSDFDSLTDIEQEDLLLVSDISDGSRTKAITKADFSRFAAAWSCQAPEDDTSYIISVLPVGVTASVHSIGFKLVSGSCKLKVFKNGVAVSGFSSWASVSSAAVGYKYQDSLVFKSGDQITAEVTLETSPVGLAITFSGDS